MFGFNLDKHKFNLDLFKSPLLSNTFSLFLQRNEQVIFEGLDDDDQIKHEIPPRIDPDWDSDW